MYNLTESQFITLLDNMFRAGYNAAGENETLGVRNPAFISRDAIQEQIINYKLPIISSSTITKVIEDGYRERTQK